MAGIQLQKIPQSLKILLLVAALVLVVPVSSSAQTVSFVARMDLPVGQGPSGIATADLNADHKLDLVIANGFSNSVSALLGNGDGTFQPSVSYPVGTSPIAVKIRDFNGDGKPDIFVVNSNSSVSILLGNGDGTFQAQVVTNIVTDQLNEVTVGDFNGDGKLDLAMPVSVTPPGNSALTVMLGRGDGTFQAPISANPGPAPTPASMKVADFNGDGKLDLVTSDSVAVSVFLGNGDGTFQAPLSSAVSMEASGFVLADFNGDGKLDLAFQGENRALVLFGNGDGTFQPVISTSVPLGSSDSVLAGDFNGDGKPDLLLPGVAVLLGNGDGTFQQPVFSPIPGLEVAVGDFNGDGKLDLATARSTNPVPFVSVALGNGSGFFQVGTSLLPPSQGQGARSPSSLIAADFTGDGKADVVELAEQQDFNGWFAVFPGAGNGAFQSPLLTFLNSPCFDLCYAAAGDFNRDGKLDLVVSVNRNIGVFLGNGDGTFQPEVDYPGGGAFVGVGDFNGDGNLDIVTADGSNISILLGNGNGSFGQATSFPVGVLASSLVVSDFNNDGKLDLAVATGASVAILLGNGNGTFGTTVAYSTDPGSFSVAIGDFNHDGKLDLATANSTSNTVSILLGNGDGTFGTATNLPVGGTPNFIAVSDFNGDQKSDIAAFNNSWEDVSILLGNGDGTFQPAESFGTLGFGDLAIADFNGDGTPDLAVGGFPISILFNRPAGPDVILNPSTLDFGNQIPGVPTTAQTVTLNNLGQSALTISSITVTGPQSKEFTESNSCGSSVDAGGGCTIDVIFNAASTGPRSATLNFTDSAPGSPQTVALSGTGAFSTVSLTPASLTFPSQDLGTISPPQVVTVSNTGVTVVIFSQISYSGDFSESNTCTAPLPVGGSCQISVIFIPTAAGNRSGVLSVTDNATGSPQTVKLSGVGGALGLSIASGGSASATVTAGQSANYDLSIGGSGVSGTATLTCTGAPMGADCSVPSSMSLSATSASTFKVAVSTTSRTTATLAPSRSQRSPWFWAAAIFGIIFLPGPVRKRSAMRVGRTLPFLLLLFLFSCGGGSSSSSQTNPNGTPAGTYQLTVKATSGSQIQSISLTLTVE
jgi:hypothetical protein